MGRSLVFDATAPDFAEQWQRIDWQLLQNSSVHCYRTDDEMEHAASDLLGIGYVLHHFDARNWRHEDEMHTALADNLGFPAYYGRNLDALNDAFTEVAEYRYGSDPGATGTVLAFAGYESFTRYDRKLASSLLDIFARGARHGLLVGHPLLFLISATSDFAAVGATPVVPSP